MGGVAGEINTVLGAARDIVAAGWGQDSLAMRDDGQTADPGGPEAVQHCPLGGIFGAISHFWNNVGTTREEFAEEYGGR
jgi:hypothetical protein